MRPRLYPYETIRHPETPALFRRFALALTIVLCVALPRAGFVMSTFKLPLPASMLALHLMFWPLLMLRALEERLPRLLLPFAFFTLTVCVAFYLGTVRYASLKIMVVETATFLGPLPAFFVVAWLLKDKRDAELATKLLVFSILCACVYGIIQFYKGAAVLMPKLTYTAGTEFSMRQLRAGAASRTLSSYGDPNVFAGSLVLFLPAVLGVFITPKRFAGEGWSRLLAGATLVCGLITLVYCNSRAGYLGILIAGSVVAWRFRGYAMRIILPIVLAVWIVSELGLTERVTARIHISEHDRRWALLDVGPRIIMAHPEGTGLGVYASARQIWPHEVKLSPASSVWHSYNSFYLHLLARTGVLGFVAFLWMCYRSVRPSWEAVRQEMRPLRHKPVVTGLLAGFLGIQLAMFFNPFYQLPGGGVNLWLSLGLAYAIARSDYASGDNALLVRK